MMASNLIVKGNPQEDNVESDITSNETTAAATTSGGDGRRKERGKKLRRGW